MARSYRTGAPKLDWDPTKRPLWDPTAMGKQNADNWLSILQGVFNEIPDGSKIIALVKAISGLDLSSEKAFFQDIATAITGVVDADISTIQMMFGSLRAFLQDIDLFSPTFDPVDAAKQFVNLLRETGKLLFPDSPLNASNLFGTAPDRTHDLVHIGSIWNGSRSTNYLWNPLFQEASSIDGGDDWTWDGTKSHSATAGAGCATVTLDGTPKDLYSSPLAVAANQQVNISLWGEWSSIAVSAGHSNPLHLQVTTYYKNVVQDVIDLDVPAVTGDSDWQLLQGSYTLPAESFLKAIDTVRITVHVDETALSGSFSVSDGMLGKSVVPNTAPKEWLQGAEDIAANIDQFAQNILDNLHIAGGGVRPSGGAFLTDLENVYANWKASHDATVTQSGTTTTGLAQLVSDVINGLRGHTGSGSDAYASLSDSAAVVADLQAAVVSLQNQQNAIGLGGNSAFVDFSLFADASTISPAGFNPIHSGSGAGKFVISGGNCIWLPANDANASVVAPFTSVETVSDYQLVGAAYASTPDWFNGTAKGQNWLFTRVSADGNTYVYLYHDLFSYELGCVVAGSKTVWRSGSWRFKNSGVAYLAAGLVGSPRQYQVLDGNTPIVTYSEVGTTSALGASNRKCGLGGSAYASGAGSNNPGAVAAWAMGDNLPPTILGVGGKMICSVGGTPYNIASGNHVLTGLFDTVALQTSGLTPDAANAGFTVNIAGWYIVAAQLYNGAAVFPSRFTMQLWKGNQSTAPAAWRYMSRESSHDLGAGSANLVPNYVSEGCLVDYFQVGDIVRLGYESSDNLGILNGEAQGIRTALTMALINRSAA